jgi:hypothetical protein
VTEAVNPGAAPVPNVPPMLYSQIEPLAPQLHKDYKLRPETDFGYAAKTNTMPLTLPEFTLAARHYPIIFIGDELHPTVALGFEREQNLFVDHKGHWDSISYIPAYVRRYPFILLGGPQDERLTLGVEATANSKAKDARPLFNDDATPTDAVKQALDFCDQFHGAYLFTRDFCDALKKTDIMEEKSVEVELSPGQRMNLGSFNRINEEKFKALPDETIVEWHKKGYLHGVCFHLQSLNNWDNLISRNAARAGRK